MRTIAAVALVLVLAGCTRKVVVESEPSRTAAPSAITMVGSYDYTVDYDGQIIRGVLNVTRSGARYDATMSSDMGALQVNAVEREGDTLKLDVETPGGPATMELEWKSADRFQGLGYLGSAAYPIAGTRRP